MSKVDDFIKNEAKGTNVIGAKSIEELVQLLKRPRRVMLLVQAGKAVDEFIAKLVMNTIISIRFHPPLFSIASTPRTRGYYY